LLGPAFTGEVANLPANLDRRLRPRITLRQISVLVVFAAIGSAVMAREARTLSNFWPFLLWELPIAFIPTTLVLVRRGPLKIWFLTFLCAIPIVGLIGLNLVVFYYHHISWRNPSRVAVFLVALAGGEALLFAGLMILARWLVPRRCPLCGWWAMLRDPSVPCARHFPRPNEARTCLACGARFRREKRATWIDVDTLNDNPIPNNLAELLAPILSRKGLGR
jgi:hypothetical protein